MSRVHRVAAMAAASVALLMTAAGPALAADVPNDDFAEHVRHAEEKMGFSGTHNPGMHQGISNWNPDHTC